MRRAHLALQIAWLALAWPGLAGALELRVGLGMQGPAPAVQSSGLSGFNEALARELCRRLQAHCAIEHMGFADILPAVQAHRIELGFGNFLRTPERERRVAFSDPIWRSSSRLAGLSARLQQLTEQQGQPPSLENLHDVRVAVVQDTQQAAYLQALPAHRRIETVIIRTMDQLRTTLRSGQADLAFMPMLSAYVLFNAEPGVVLEFVGPAYSGEGLGGSVHIALAHDAQPLRSQLNQALAAMRADGTWQRIVRRFFPFNLD